MRCGRLRLLGWSGRHSEGARLLLARRHLVQGVGAAPVEEGLTFLELGQAAAPVAAGEPDRRRAADGCADKGGEDDGEPDVAHVLCLHFPSQKSLLTGYFTACA